MEGARPFPRRARRLSSRLGAAELTRPQIFTPILHWIEGKSGPAPKPVPYPYGSRGPKELDSFIGKYGFKRTVPD